MFVDKHGHGKGGVLENENNKNKRASRKIRISAGRPQCINRPRFLTFLKGVTAPQVGVPLLLMACCYATLILMLILNANFNAMLICFIGEIQAVRSYMVELGWVEIA